MNAASFSRLVAVFSVVGMSLVGLVACAPDAAPVPDPTTPPATNSSTPEPTSTAVEPVGTPVTVSCDELVSAQTMYDYNSNFGLLSDFTPAVGTLAASIVADSGVACRWVNQTSGETIDVAVANPPKAQLTARKNELVTSSNSVPTYGVEGYFQVNGEIGEAEAFSDPYWIVVTSNYFGEPGDATPIVRAVIDALT